MKPVHWRQVWSGAAGALALWFALDALAFRTGLYARWLEPDSSAGLFELVLGRERANQQDLGSNLVLTLGNSRFAYLPRLANERTSESGLVFQSAGVAGSDVRSWFYMLRDLDPTARRYRAIVFGLDDYDDEDTTPPLADDIRALHYSIARLRLSDAAELASSYSSWELRYQALRGALFKGFVFQKDLQAFAASPSSRLETVRQARGGFREWTYNYDLPELDLRGVHVDWQNWKATFPQTVDPARRATFDFVLRPPHTEQTGRYAAFRRHWFSQILDRYRGSPTRIVFLKLPRAPFPRPEGLVQKRTSSIHELAAQYGARLTPDRAFEPLERPELFQDYYHLNREGCRLFSAQLVDEVGRAIR